MFATTIVLEQFQTICHRFQSIPIKSRIFIEGTGAGLETKKQEPKSSECVENLNVIMIDLLEIIESKSMQVL